MQVGKAREGGKENGFREQYTTYTAEFSSDEFEHPDTVYDAYIKFCRVIFAMPTKRVSSEKSTILVCKISRGGRDGGIKIDDMRVS